jgi:SAM-dependent methyltransferase
MRGNEDALFARRAGSFGMHAAVYAEHRPDYPATGIRWALSGAAHPPRQVLDLAAGTGKLTEGIVALGLEVTAVEPDPDMLAQLRRRLPGVSALDGTAERIPLPAASLDAVLVGQAFHWFDQHAALIEIARVLRPGGVLGALWNHEDLDVPWVAELIALNRTTASHREVPVDEIARHSLFGSVEREDFPHSQRCTADSLTATIGTHSHTLVVSGQERADLLGKVRAYLGTRPETARGEFELPIRTTVLRTRRVAVEDQA